MEYNDEGAMKLGFEYDVFFVFFMGIPFSAFMGIVGVREMQRGVLIKFLRRIFCHRIR